MTNMRTIGYRADIDGLRAVAVLGVLLFHLKLRSVEGGFTGVDIFFVISGFLITSIIERRVEARAFSFSDFYVSRIRRLMPALFAVLAATSVGAVAFLAPSDLVSYSHSLLGAVFSVSNFVFLMEAGYWDATSDLKPLLHTWSLGVEEQFYLVWPAAIVLLLSYARRFLWSALVIAALLSLGAAVYLNEMNSAAAWFLLPTRVFEFAIGALAIPMSRSGIWQGLKARKGVETSGFVLGMVLILGCFLDLDGSRPFPGLWALIPCLGAFLIILTGQSVLGRVLLSNKPMVWIGRISYSLYLVHWPIISLYRYKTGMDLTGVEILGLFAASFVAAILLYYLVETPFRQGGTSEPQKARLRPALFLAVIGGCSLTLSAAAMTAVQQAGLPQRFNGGTAMYLAKLDKTYRQERARYILDICDGKNDKVVCGTTKSDTENVLIVGNSWAISGLISLQAAYPDTNFLFSEMPGCSPLFPEHIEKRQIKVRAECVEKNRARAEWLRDNPGEKVDTVVIVSFIAPAQANTVSDTVRSIAGLGYRVVFFGEIPTYDEHVLTVLKDFKTVEEAKAHLHTLRRSKHKAAPDLRMRKKINLPSMGFVPRMSLFCPDDKCRLATQDGGDLIVFDKHHISEGAALELAEHLRETQPDLFSSERPEWNPDRYKEELALPKK